MPSCWSISIGRCVSAGASRRRRRAPTRRGRSAASSTSTSGRRRSPSGRSRRRSPSDYIVATYREHAHYLARTRRRARGDGGAVRQGDRLRRRPGRLDASLRRQPPLPRGLGDRRRPRADRRRRGVRVPVSRRARRHALLLRRRHRQHGRLPRRPRARVAVEAADRLHLREQPVRDGDAALPHAGGRGRRRAGARLPDRGSRS